MHGRGGFRIRAWSGREHDGIVVALAHDRIVVALIHDGIVVLTHNGPDVHARRATALSRNYKRAGTAPALAARVRVRPRPVKLPFRLGNYIPRVTAAVDKPDNATREDPMKLSHRPRWLSALLLPLVGVAAHAASLSPASLALLPGDHATIAVSGARGTPTLANSNPTAVSASLAGGTLKVAANAVGIATLSVTDRRGTRTAKVTVHAPLGVAPGNASLHVGGTAVLTVSHAIGAISIGNSNRMAVSATLSGNAITVTGRSGGSAELTVRDTRSTVKVLVSVTSTSLPPVTSPIHPGRLLASNCFQCHGTNGSGGFERLQGSRDLLSELREFASGHEDAGGIMAAHAVGYTDEQLRLIADFLSRQ